MKIPPLIATGLLLLLAPGSVAAQEEDAATADDERSGVFSEIVEVNVVNVEVYVTDKKGERVTDLSRDDFEIYEDGRPVAITNFSLIEGGKMVRRVEGGEEVAPAAAVQPAPLPEDQRLHLVVYIDNFNIRPFNRNRVFRRLREFLTDKLSEGDKVMLVSYDRSLHVRRPFTSDPALIASALYELETVSAFGVHTDSERRDMLQAIEDANGPEFLRGRLRQYAESQFNDLVFTLEALKEFNNSLAGLPGRKAILYVSDGIPMTPGQDLFYAAEQKFTPAGFLTEMMDFNASRRYDELVALANANRITFYTIDAAGLRVYSSSTVERSSAGTPGLSTLVDSVQISNLQGPLQFLAEGTGGQAIINTNDAGPGLDRVAEDFNTYYSLGYTPGHSGDGRYHKVEVKVRQKGLRVRHREGYRDKTVAARMADGTMSTLLYGYEDNPLGIVVSFGEASRRDDGLYQVPIVVQIPLDRLVLVPQAEFRAARVRLFVAAMDEDGGTAPVQETPIPIQIPDDRFEEGAGQAYNYQIDLLMRDGAHQVAVGVRDEMGAVASFLRRPLLVGG